MALIQDSPKKKQRKRSCFGFSFQQKDKIDSVCSKRKQSSCFSFRKFQRKQSPAKTISFEINTVEGGAEKLNRSREIHVLKSAAVKKRQLPTATTVYEPQVPVTGQTIRFNKFNKAKHEDITVDTKCKKLEYFSCENFVTGSAEDKHEISRTVSLPPQITKRNKQSVLAIKKDTSNFDSVIGMSILMVTLIIMVFWGKFCAILCTSAWFYFLPRFRAKNEALIAEQNDVNSNECKKKVVLNGFLERSHRNVVGF